MITPKQVISTPQSNGVSATFTAQWYSDVAAILNLSYGTVASIQVALEGSFDLMNWVSVNTPAAFTSGSPKNIEKPVTGYYLYYRLRVVANSVSNGVSSWITAAWIGAGGA